MDNDVQRLVNLLFVMVLFGCLIGAIMFSVFGEIFIAVAAVSLICGVLAALIIKWGG